MPCSQRAGRDGRKQARAFRVGLAPPGGGGERRWPGPPGFAAPAGLALSACHLGPLIAAGEPVARPRRCAPAPRGEPPPVPFSFPLRPPGDPAAAGSGLGQRPCVRAGPAAPRPPGSRELHRPAARLGAPGSRRGAAVCCLRGVCSPAPASADVPAPVVQSGRALPAARGGQPGFSPRVSLAQAFSHASLPRAGSLACAVGISSPARSSGLPFPSLAMFL